MLNEKMLLDGMLIGESEVSSLDTCKDLGVARFEATSNRLMDVPNADAGSRSIEQRSIGRGLHRAQLVLA
jgi:hypothetical protein